VYSCNRCRDMLGNKGPCVFKPQTRREAQQEEPMKFEVETISEGRVLVTKADGSIAVTSDEGLGAFLRANGADPAPAKRSYPKGTRKRRTRAQIEADKAGKAEAPAA
jgi:hypothetical protein